MPNYTLQYVYQLDDFDTAFDAVPNEQGARAQGSPPWELQLNAGATPIPIDVTDGDTDFNEIGGSDQELTNPVTIDGVTYPAGTSIIINYVITTDSGFEGYSITLGANNSGNNTTTAFISNQPMVPGQLYEFTSEGNIGNTAIPASEFACFTAGTAIEVADGTRRIEELAVGDLVMTLDDGPQPIRWIGQRTVPGVGNMAPVMIGKGMLGATSDLTVSPNHRMMITGQGPELLLGEDAVLVAAKSLVNGLTIAYRPTGFVTYVHMMFDKHQIIRANGCLTESLYLGKEAVAGMDQAQLVEIFQIFPKLASFRQVTIKPARYVAKNFEGRALAALLPEATRR